MAATLIFFFLSLQLFKIPLCNDLPYDILFFHILCTNSQRIISFTFVTSSSLLRLIQSDFVALACSVTYGKKTPSITEQRHR
ncbi:hypothetical protein T05_5400 [Trichinella murrelli]|uniref:Secreted protein n=1 Tax=Trichinella murrelli TaxID=144512 RepID=A0A0V0TD45_9BILA|nr:hypothetical protein T05_5400 [Trichinella murrelli]